MEDTGNISTLPSEVINEILSYCNLHSLLQLRLVCNRLKTHVDSSPQFPIAIQDIQINLNPSTLKIFVESAPSFPFSNFHLINTGRLDHSIYNDSLHLRTFKQTFCPQIRKLRVQLLRCCTSQAELDFFKCLRNLRDLHITSLEPQPQPPRPKSCKSVPKLPFRGQNHLLKRLAVDQETDCTEYLVHWIQNCPSLQFIRIPESTGNSVYENQQLLHIDNTCPPYILRLGAQGHLQHLQTLDLNKQSLAMTLCSPDDLQFFDKIVADQKIRLENVSPSFVVNVRDAVGLETFTHFKQRIVSFQGMSDLLKEDNLDNLEDLNLLMYDWVSEDTEWTWDSMPLQLPGLKKMRAWITDTHSHESPLASLFLPQEHKSRVKDLEINYTFPGYPSPHPMRFAPENLNTSFRYLTQLIIRRTTINEHDRFSAGELERLVEVVSRKELLQELTLITSEGIPEAVFFGRNRNTPDFLRLQNLRKFTLKSTWEPEYSDSVDKIREECLRMGNAMLELLSRMSLTHLHISGWGWDRLTLKGIQSLVEGQFGQSVLWVRLDCLEKTSGKYFISDLHSESLEGLARVAHGNRVAKGLTSITFEQLKLSRRNKRNSGMIRWLVAD